MNRIGWSKLYDDVSDTMENFESFLSERIEFLDRVWIDGCKYHSIRFAGFYASPLCVIEGDSVTLPAPEEFALPKNSVWIREDTGEDYALYQEKLTEDIVLRALVPEEQHSQNAASGEELEMEPLSIRMRITLLSLAVFAGLLAAFYVIDYRHGRR